MTHEEIISALRAACKERSVCALYVKGEESPRMVHPYGVCFSKKDNLLFVCASVQALEEKKPPYRNFLFERIDAVELLDESFVPLQDFNPFSDQYSGWLFHVLKQ